MYVFSGQGDPILTSIYQYNTSAMKVQSEEAPVDKPTCSSLQAKSPLTRDYSKSHSFFKAQQKKEITVEANPTIMTNL